MKNYKAFFNSRPIIIDVGNSNNTYLVQLLKGSLQIILDMLKRYIAYKRQKNKLGIVFCQENLI